MVQEEVIVQTSNEVSTIDYMRKTNNIINAQSEEMQNNMNMISEKLDIIVDNAFSDTPITSVDTNVDLSEVTSLIEDIDTTIMESNTQDILSKMDAQQRQIDDTSEKLDLILSKL